MKTILTRAVFLMMTALWMAVIFGFSAQTGAESGSLSGVITKPLTDLLVALVPALEDTAYEQLYLQVDSGIRIAAHFAEYALLGVLLCLLLRSFRIEAWWLGWLIGTLYAVTDEWHQAYSPQRSCELKDVLVDSAGVLCGVLAVLFISRIWRKMHVHHS